MRIGLALDAATRGNPAPAPPAAMLDLNYASTQALNVAYETFSRASIAYSYNSAGTLVVAPLNMLTRSSELDNAAWTKQQCSVTANAATAPDGTVTADKVIEDNTSNNHRISRNPTGVIGVAYTVSIYAKAAERSTTKIEFFHGAATVTASYDLIAGTVTGSSGSPDATAITAVGSGWYRCSVSKIATGTGLVTYFYVGTGVVLGDNTSGLYLWGGQVEAASGPTSYIPTTSATLYGPRFDYDPSSARTNLTLQSQDLSSVSWGSGGGGLAVVTSGVVTAPNGGTAYTLSDNSAVAVLGLLQNKTVTSGTTTAYTGSVYVKAGTSSVISLRVVLGSATTVSGEVVVDLTTGAAQWRTANVGTSFAVTDVGSGWYRVSSTITGNGAANTVLSLEMRPAFAVTYSPTLGTSAQGTAHFWGAQIETGSSATAYIATTTAAVTSSTALGLLIEAASTNLFLNSAAVSSWTSLGDAAIMADSAAAPDGTGSADLVTMGASGSVPGGTLTFAAATTYSISIFVKDGATSPFLRVRVSTAASSVSGYFNLSTGALGSFGTGMSGGRVDTLAATGWKRYSFQYLPASGDEGSRSIVFAGVSANNSGTASGALTLWGAQVEAVAFPTSYIPTTAVFTGRTSAASYYSSTGVLSSAASGVARTTYSYINGSWLLAGLMLEAAATNLVLQSQTFDNASWSKSQASITANAIAAPDGTTTADKLVENGTTNTHFASQSVTITAGSTVTYSVFAKAAERTFLQINLGNAGDVAFLRFNLSTGAFLQSATINSGTNFTSPSSVAVNLSNGWYRITFTIVTAVVTSIDMGHYLYNGSSTYAGDGTSGLYLWGAQLETGNVATSYIVTTTVSATRSADTSTVASATRAVDVCTMPVTTIPSFSATEGTVVVSVDRYTAMPPFVRLFRLDDTTNNNAIQIIGSSAGSNLIYATIGTAGVTVMDTQTSSNFMTVNVPFSAGLAWKLDDCAYAFNGGPVTADTAVAIPTVTTLRIGINVGNGGPLSGHIRRLRYYNTRVLDATLQALTTTT